MAAEQTVSISDRITSIIELSESSTTLIVIFAVLCILLGALIIRAFINIWQSQINKRRFFIELINRYENDAGVIPDDAEDEAQNV